MSENVTIGTQVWMAENLKTTTYHDNKTIPYVANPGIWSGLTTHAYCLYNDDPDSYKSTFGVLYNSFVISAGKLCPTGWHVPTDEEWTLLTDYLGGGDVAGGKLKESGMFPVEFYKIF